MPRKGSAFTKRHREVILSGSLPVTRKVLKIVVRIVVRMDNSACQSNSRLPLTQRPGSKSVQRASMLER